MKKLINFIKRVFGFSEHPPKPRRFVVAIIQAGYVNDNQLNIVSNLYVVQACNEQESVSAAVSHALENEDNRWMKIFNPNSMEIP